MIQPIVLEQVDTDIGTIVLSLRKLLIESRWVTEIKIDDSLLMSSVSPVSERQLSIGALSLHQGGPHLRVLVGGLGLGYTAEAALEDGRVASVCVVEKMDFIVEWMRKGLLPLSEQFADDPRIEIVQGDVYSHLLGPVSTTYDLILIDVDHSPDDLLADTSAAFYTVEGQRQVALHLNPGGVLGVWSAFDNDDFAEVLAKVYPYGYREEVSWPDDEYPDSEYHNVLFFSRRDSNAAT